MCQLYIWSPDDLTAVAIKTPAFPNVDCLCGLVVRVPAYRPRGSDSIHDATKFSEK
jgi:hypothetical protein